MHFEMYILLFVMQYAAKRLNVQQIVKPNTIYGVSKVKHIYFMYKVMVSRSSSIKAQGHV